MHGCASQESERPFPAEHDDAEDEVDDLENGERFHCSIEVFCEEVPEDLWPEEAFDCGGYLICWNLLVESFESNEKDSREGDVQMEAVRTMSRAQWFLISLPMTTKSLQKSSLSSDFPQSSSKERTDFESKQRIKGSMEVRYPSLRTKRR